MSQPTAAEWGLHPTGPGRGTDVASRANKSFNALLSSHSGDTAPTYAVEGTRWLDTAVATAWAMKIYGGGNWWTEWILNPSTGTFAMGDPWGIPTAWTSHVLGATAASGSLGGASGTRRYKKFGRVVFIEFDMTISSVGTGSGAIFIQLPMAATGAYFVLSGREIATHGKMLNGTISPNSSSVSVLAYDNLFPATNGSRLILSGIYEAAS